MTVAANWAQLKNLRPKLAPDVQIQVQEIRGESWAILRNALTGQHVRLNEMAMYLIERCDGQTTLQSICDSATADGFALDHHAIPTVLTTLCHSSMISLGVPGEEERLLRQYHHGTTLQRRQRWLSPLAIRLPLHDPDRWLTHLSARLSWAFQAPVWYGSMALMALALILGGLRFTDISVALANVATSPGHWWLFLILYPLLKVLHELAHAVSIKHWGGEVHEVGITLLVLIPVPYVDASDATFFTHRRQRMLVSAAGLLVECTLAAIALLIWLLVEPGLVSNIAFAVAVMGSASTLLFNANPLLRFDGYYILQDWLDIPNLASRASRYYHYLLQRYLLRVTTANSPITAAGEQPWLLFYGAASPVYRWLVMIVIAVYLSRQYFIAGTLLGLFALFQLGFKPLRQALRYLRDSPDLQGQRGWSCLTVLAAITIPSLLVIVLPVPASTRVEGVVWVPEQAQVYATQSGEVIALHAAEGQWVERGQLLMQLVDPTLQTRLISTRAQSAALDIEYRSTQLNNPALAAVLAIDLLALGQQIAQLTDRIAQLDVYAGSAGRFAIPTNVSLPGRYIKQGELLAYIVNPGQLIVRAVVDQHQLGRIQSGVVLSTIRLATALSAPVPATLTRQKPAGDNRLPSPALAYNGRSGIAVASQTDNELKTLERVFHLELALPSEVRTAGIGGRAYVTLQHQSESLGRRWWRSSRQLLLKHISV